MIDATTPVAPLIPQNHGVGFRSMADTMHIDSQGTVKTTHEANAEGKPPYSSTQGQLQ